MRSFSERKLWPIGAAGIAVIAAMVVGALQFQNVSYLNQRETHSAYFTDAGGLLTGATVEVSGFPAGKVQSIELDDAQVLVTFSVAKTLHLGEGTEAAIKTRSLLGTKVLNVTPRGGGELSATIPATRTSTPYQLPDTLGELANTISGLNTNQLSDSLTTLSQTFANTPESLKNAVNGVSRFAQTLNQRDAELRTLLANAAKATTVLANRSDQVVSLVRDTNALLVQLESQSSAVERIWYSISSVATQLKNFIGENREQLRPALDKLNGVLAIIDNRKERLQEAVKLLNKYAMSLGESLASGPFFKGYVANLLPGQFVQPFVDAAFSDLGLDPNTLLPSQLNDPQIGQPGTPALPVPYPRTGQGGEPRLTLPDAITGKPGDEGCGPPGLPLPGPTGCYPYREPPPVPPPGGPPPGPPALPASGEPPSPTPPSPVFQPAPGEVFEGAQR